MKKHWVSVLLGHPIQMDNTTAVARINHAAETRSLVTAKAGENILSWAERHVPSNIVCHLLFRYKIGRLPQPVVPGPETLIPTQVFQDLSPMRYARCALSGLQIQRQTR